MRLAVDGQPQTFWDTAWRTSAPPLPHTLTLDLGALLWVDGLTYLPRQDGAWQGTVTGYRVEASVEGTTWMVASTGAWAGDPTEKQTRFAPVQARAVRLVALAGMGGLPYASAAEVGVYGVEVGP